MNPITTTVAATTGVCAGPWLRAVIFSHSTAYGRERRVQCPRCRHPVRSGRQLPVTGRCPRCSRRLGAPLLAVEATAAITLAVIAWRSPNLTMLLLLSALGSCGIVLSFIDIGVHRLPRRIVHAAAAGITTAMLIASAAGQQWHQLATATASAAVCGAFYLVLALISGGIGLGDVRWATVLALACGWFGIRTAATALAAGIAAAAMTAAILLLLRRVHRNTAMPYGPFLSAGALAAITVHEW